jgi:RND family efflux transporter MFP subunit
MPAGRWLAVLAPALALAPLGCNRATPATGSGAAPAAGGPVAVKVASPKPQPLHWTIEQPATVQPFEVTPIVAKLPGYVREIAPDAAAIAKGAKPEAVIDIGSAVRKDQLLAFVDIPELAAEAEEKRAMVGQAKAELTQAEKDLAVVDAQVAAAEAMVTEAKAGVTKAAADVARWETELTQAKKLVATNVIDAQSRDVVDKQHEAAKAAKAEADARTTTAAAQLLERQARRGRVEADVVAAQKRVAVAEAAVKRLEALLTYTVVRAPFAGVVTARNVHPGHFLQPAPGSSGQVLFTVARLDVVRVFVDVPEGAAAKAGPGATAVVRVPALGNKEFDGTITRTAGVIQPDTRALRAEIDLENKGGELKPGMYASVTIPAESADAMVLPAGCVLAADETNYVYLVEGGKAVKYRVQVGRSEGATVQVFARRKAIAIAGNWEPFVGSEQVVVGNLGALTDGATVEIGQ